MDGGAKRNVLLGYAARRWNAARFGENEVVAQEMQPLSRLTGVRLTYKVTAAVMVLVFVSVGLVGTLSYYKYKSILNSLIQSRAEVTLSSLQSTVQAPLQLGLSLADVRTIKGVLQSTIERDRVIAQISVFEIGGTQDILYSTDNSLQGTPPPSTWVESARTETGLWSHDGPNGRTIGMTVVDRLDQPVGGIALTYKNSYAAQRLMAVGDELIDYALIIIGGTVAIAFLIVQVVFRPVSHHLTQLTQRACNVGGAGQTLIQDDDEIDSSFRSFEEGAARAERALDDLEHAIASVDDTPRGVDTVNGEIAR